MDVSGVTNALLNEFIVIKEFIMASIAAHT